MGRKTDRQNSPGSFHTISDSESDFESSPPPAKRARKSTTTQKASLAKSKKNSTGDIEDLGSYIRRDHAAEYHSTLEVIRLQRDLLNWFEGVREKRGMPWRKRYDHDLSPAEKGQRAYEIWVSEVMLQQTQVATVIEYWKRWMEKWPTIADLAKADIEEVNAAWRGLGYYRRARSLLKGAQTVMSESKYNGRLPRDPAVLEKQIDGVGRYTAGAITSMAYGVRTPIVDGNVHRLLTRLLAVHAPQADGATIKFLWKAAEELVDALPEEHGIAGDWNQALMELGSQICKPVGPDCQACPLRPSCKVYKELSTCPPESSSKCKLCAPVPGTGDHMPSITIFPMKKEKKTSREENEVVSVVEWTDGTDRRWLFTKRPDKGLLAGLFEPPTTPVGEDSTTESRTSSALSTLAGILGTKLSELERSITSTQHFGSIPHIFSHINMTYHISLVKISTPTLPSIETGVWLDEAGVADANIGTGVKKVWKEIYGSWGSFTAGASKGVKVRPKKVTVKKTEVTTGKVVKKIMMPLMPQKSA